MIQNSPKFRAVLYVAAIVLQVAAFAARAADKTGAWATAVQDTANFVGGLAGVTAVSNLAITRTPQEPGDAR